MSYVVVHAEGMKDGETGFLLYPSSSGCFREDTLKADFTALFQGDAPDLPFGNAGKRFGPESFTDIEMKRCMLEHLKKKYSLPKDADTYWLKDEVMHNDLIFPLITPYAEKREENPEQTAVRGLWECTGLRVPTLEYLGQFRDKHVFSTHICIDDAKWQWMNHQGEKLTLTDWGVCPHFDLLDELGVSRIVFDSYCRTHGGPRFITDINDHLVEGTTREIIEHFALLKK